MTPLVVHTGRAVPLGREDVDTDQIVPSEFCKRVTKSGFEDALFARWRTDPDFELNQPAYAGATILLSGKNFGIGSSREHAVWALRDSGFVAVVAAGFGDIFRRNALNNGLLPVDLPAPVVAGLSAAVTADPELEITIDLADLEVRMRARSWAFTVEDRARWLLMNGYDTIEVTLQRGDEISCYENERRYWLPAVPLGCLRDVEPAAGDLR
jgi:3-isopropylmalate/(R)-2-methylmalate dehydratase small subunit